MKIIEVKSLAIPEIKVIRFGRFNDDRGYFTEIYRKSDYQNNPQMNFMKGVEFTQCNDAFSKAGTMRGLHFQWNPYMGKMIRVLFGHLIDLVLDIRKSSPTLGKIVAYDMASKHENDFDEWIWLPPGFAHGCFFPDKDSHIEYFCTGQYSPGCETSISPLAKDIDWSICDTKLKKIFDSVVPTTKLITDKDKNGSSLSEWLKDKKSDNFIYGKS